MKCLHIDCNHISMCLCDKKNNKIVINIQNKEFMQQKCIVVKIFWDHDLKNSNI